MRKKRNGRKRATPALACFRSSITTGSRLLHDVDGRSAWMRRLRDLTVDMSSDLGGVDVLSTAQVALIRRASLLTLQAELMESRWEENNGEAPPRSLDTYQRVTGALRRTLRDLGLRRVARDVGDYGTFIDQAKATARGVR